MYFKTVWGFSGTDEQKELQKKQLRDVLMYLGADVTMYDVNLEGEKGVRDHHQGVRNKSFDRKWRK